MNTGQIKRFAQEARRKLIQQVGAKLDFVLTTDSAELREKSHQLKQLREELEKTKREQLIEKVAYTWFNRLMALRFLDANDYQPLGIRVITPKDGYTTPELLDEAKRGSIPTDLKVNKQRVNDLLDAKIPSTNPQNEAFKELLIAACNHLHTTFPFLFEKIDDYTELLLPDDLTSDFSIVTDVRNGMPVDDCKNVEIIGWLYQFYISEEKDRLINAKKRYNANEIAPVTQLFTPKWIVQYMVDNTLGQLWKEARPKTNITKHLEFYIKPENETIIPKREIRSPEEISFFDPCVGSAHILCYAYDVFHKIYEEEGYNSVDISELIITKNLFGIDIDERAAQLASFALMMKGRQYNRRFLRKGIVPNITAFRNFETHPKFINAKTLGSLIKISQEEIDEIRVDDNSIFTEQQKQLKRQASFLATKYDIVVTNPPYLNSTYMSGELKQFVEKEYNSTKSDLFACMLIQASEITNEEGFIGYISPYVWMFISSYEKMREFIVSKTTITSLIQLEYNAFEPACVPIATFTLRNSFLKDYLGSYIKLSDFTGHQNQAPRAQEAIKNPKCGWFYTAYQKDFEKIPSIPIGYWISNKKIRIFEENNPIKEIAPPKQGLATGNNDRFLRLWFEVAINKCFKKWIPINKGGEFRKWYGNNFFVVNWDNNGYEIKNFYDQNGKLRSRPQNQNYYFKEGISWSTLSSSSASFRFSPKTHLFETKGSTLFPQEGKLNIVTGYLNSVLVNSFLKVLSPTLDFHEGPIGNLPFKVDVSVNEDKITNCFSISIEDWDSQERSIDYKLNNLLRIHGQDLEESYDLYQQYWKNKFFQLHQNEEELNRQFIEIYGLQDELTPDVPLEDITILQDELDRKALAKLNKKLLRNPQTLAVTNYHEIELPFIASEVLEQFISYSVGCMFGRYSLDKEGLILANQGETLQDYLKIIGAEKSPSGDALSVSKWDLGVTFLPDDDNIIPVLEDEWFDDDILGRFFTFLKVTFGEKNFNKNLTFIEEQIGMDMRRYFTKNFYADHVQRYKKRPIYWMFSSPKGSFNALIYMHRYTPDTVSNILNKYLKEFIGKLKTRKEHLQHIQVQGSPAEKTKAIKESDAIDKMLLELHEYERDTLYPLATQRISIDLDDGVLVNYNKFGKAIKEIAGLNDKKTKDKVRGFDWIDVSEIR